MQSGSDTIGQSSDWIPSDYLFDTLQAWANYPQNIPVMTEWQRNALMQYFINHPLLQRGGPGAPGNIGKGEASAGAVQNRMLRNLFEKPTRGEEVRRGGGVEPGVAMPDWLKTFLPRMAGKQWYGRRGDLRGTTVPDPKMMISAILEAGKPGHAQQWMGGRHGGIAEEMEQDLFGEVVGKPLTGHLYGEPSTQKTGMAVARSRFGVHDPWKDWTESQKRVAPSIYDALWKRAQQDRHRWELSAKERNRASRPGLSSSDLYNSFANLAGTAMKMTIPAAMPGLGQLIGGGYFTGPGGMGQKYNPQAWAAEQPGGGGMPPFGTPEYEEWLRQYGGGMQYSPNWGWGSYNWGGY